ncbi:MAG: TetR/AcrR family transcriptional regulator [Sphingomonas sp.]
MSAGEATAETEAVRRPAARVSNADRTLQSRTAILAATEGIMREEGYAAVSSRRIAAAAGLKSQLVHYHFKTMDDLYFALLRQVEEAFFQRLAEAMASRTPLRALWAVCRDPHGPGLNKEFMAMATHHPVLRDEIARSAERTRTILAAQIARALPENDIALEAWPPLALAVLMDGAARLILADGALGASLGHKEAIAFVEAQIDRLEGQRG